MSDAEIRAALARAVEDAALSAPVDAPPEGHPRKRHLAIGDPQAPAETFFTILDHHDLLGKNGRLSPDVMLVSMGDHFDWGGPDDRDRAQKGGAQILSWLAAHPRPSGDHRRQPRPRARGRARRVR